VYVCVWCECVEHVVCVCMLCMVCYKCVVCVCMCTEKEMATHSSVLAWRIPGTGEPGGLLSMGLHRVGHD